MAACELVHSLVLLLLGRCANQTEDMQAKNPADKIYEKLFPVILDLAVDMEQVCFRMINLTDVTVKFCLLRFESRLLLTTTVLSLML